ncbi:hypothetical protein DY000_02003924 [Brassica cretica]|uniref:Uncharacterized protein n=1 Tax=Brassica cretica TaxID=69181 RepID=A0ABQ7CC02_BRACR|nr:hypothetical protein DY000_02003924 [Brassica cretica]
MIVENDVDTPASASIEVGDGETVEANSISDSIDEFVAEKCTMDEGGMLERKNMLMYMQMEIERSELEKRRGVSVPMITYFFNGIVSSRACRRHKRSLIMAQTLSSQTPFF